MYQFRTRSVIAAILVILIFTSGCNKDSKNSSTEPDINMAFTADAQTPPDSSVSLQFGSISGEDMNLDVYAKKVADVYGAAFALHFDPAVFEYAGATEGNFFNSNQSPTTFMAAGGTGVVTIGCSLLGSEVQPVNGSGTICSIVFRAKEPGQTQLTFREHRLFDSDGLEIADVKWFGGLAILAE